MTIINKLINTAAFVHEGREVVSNPVTTLLTLPPLIVKGVSASIATIGDILTYTVTITNVSLLEIDNIQFIDVLPDGCTYVVGSFKVNGTPAVPTITANTLSYLITSIAGVGIATILFQGKVVGGTI